MGTRSFPGVKCGRDALLTTRPPSSAAVMEEYGYTFTQRLGHIGPVTRSRTSVTEALQLQKHLLQNRFCNKALQSQKHVCHRSTFVTIALFLQNHFCYRSTSASEVNLLQKHLVTVALQLQKHFSNRSTSLTEARLQKKHFCYRSTSVREAL